MKGSGSKADPYIIAEPMDFANLMLNIQDGETFKDKYILQTADIELLAYNPYLGIRSEFAGIYNGNGHSIKYKVSGAENCLFPKVTGTVMNLCVEGSVENSLFGAGIARALSGGGAIVNCVVDVDLYASSVGGISVNAQSGARIVGCAYVGEINKDSSTSGDIAASVNKAA
jgi:hypothetical protein